MQWDRILHPIIDTSQQPHIIQVNPAYFSPNYEMTNIKQCYNHNTAIIHLVWRFITVFACKRNLLLCNLCFIHHYATHNILLINTIFLETVRLFSLANLAGLGKIQTPMEHFNETWMKLEESDQLWRINCFYQHYSSMHQSMHANR